MWIITITFTLKEFKIINITCICTKETYEVVTYKVEQSTAELVTSNEIYQLHATHFIFDFVEGMILMNPEHCSKVFVPMPGIVLSSALLMILPE